MLSLTPSNVIMDPSRQAYIMDLVTSGGWQYTGKMRHYLCEFIITGKDKMARKFFKYLLHGKIYTEKKAERNGYR